MEGKVKLQQCLRLTGHEGAAHPTRDGAQAFYSFRWSAKCRTGHREILYLTAQFADLLDLVAADFRDPYTGVGTSDHQPFLFQLVKRIPDGAAANRKLLRDVLLDDPIAHSQFPAHDTPA